VLVTEIVTTCGSFVIGIIWDVWPEDIFEPLTSIVAWGSTLTGVKVTRLTQLATVSRYVKTKGSNSSGIMIPVFGQLWVRLLKALDGSVACSAEAVGTKHTRQKHAARRRDKNFLIIVSSNFYSWRVLISELDQDSE
jgi:hypothetical protein